MRVLRIMFIVCAAGFMANAGCSIRMGHEPLDTPSRVFSDHITVAKQVERPLLRAGWGHVSVFWIPIVPIHIEGNSNAEIMAQVHDAVRQVGYQIQIVDNGASVPEPVLSCKVEEFNFHNYTWLFPLVPTWGCIKMRLELVSGGQVLWARTFDHDGMTLNFFDGYTIAARQAMDKILNQMVKELSSEEFHRALTTKT